MDAATAQSMLASMMALPDQSNLNAMPNQAPAPDAVVAPVGSSALPMNNDPNNNLGNMAGMNGLNNDPNNLANMAGMLNSNGMNNMNVPAQAPAQAAAGGMNPNDLNLMNAVLMQQQAPGGMNPLLLQAMMNQGMLANPMGNVNLLQQGMMNPMLGGMGCLNSNIQGGIDNSANNNANNAPAPGVDNNSMAPAAPAPSNAPAPADTNISNDNMLLAQLLQNPMTAQLLAQGINPMLLLQAQNPLAQVNPLAALGLGMNGLGAGLAAPTDVASAGLGAAAAHPNALFSAFNNPAIPQVGLPQAPNADDGALKQASKPGGKKHGKKKKLTGKPKRPLSAYNYFFRAERSRILDSISSDAKKEAKDDEVKKEPGIDEDAHSAKENDKDYDKVGPDGKKIPHGKIGFESLAKRIGKRWQNLGPEEMETYKKLADEDMTRYKKEMEAFLTKEATAGMAEDGELMVPGFHSVLSKRKGGEEAASNPKKKRSKKVKAEATGETTTL